VGFGDLKRILKPPRGFRLTKAGKVFFAFLVCLIFVSLSTGNNLLYLVLAAMLGFMVVSGVQSELNLRTSRSDASCRQRYTPGCRQGWATRSGTPGTTPPASCSRTSPVSVYPC